MIRWNETTLIRIQSGFVVGTLVLLLSATTWISHHELAGSMHMVMAEMTGHTTPVLETSHLYRYYSEQHRQQRTLVTSAQTASDYSD